MSVQSDPGRTKMNPVEDWLRPGVATASRRRDGVRRIGRVAINRSPLARKIVSFNLLAILTFVLGVVVLNPSRDSLLFQRFPAISSDVQ